MKAEEIIARVREAVPDAVDIEAQGADCDFAVLVVSPTFAGMLPVKRQQLVLAGFTELLASGELHALSVKAKTPEELAASAAAPGLTQLQL
ncbi:BolA family protein [Pseudomaricurvus sp. HS19]|uniref:BolA family protein n=1 Tax=Pseudomaricurvus sp. HS19 TaxID=2692626 RepID=UPI00136DC3CA|nr:BolA/IbaG family iron-sulfur metabolism protein [Pseudomaricurvus sp. HS19]MYM62275.1 BolA/IbaG family iron-sulfur metabolism protein [Pseudomaricurvus sp. HS19]